MVDGDQCGEELPLRARDPMVMFDFEKINTEEPSVDVVREIFTESRHR